MAKVLLRGVNFSCSLIVLALLTTSFMIFNATKAIPPRNDLPAWASDTPIWPQILLLTIACVSLVFCLGVFYGYFRGGHKRAEKVAVYYTVFSVFFFAFSIIMWAVGAAVLQNSKDNSDNQDLWGWACVDNERRALFEDDVQYSLVCRMQVSGPFTPPNHNKTNKHSRTGPSSAASSKSWSKSSSSPSTPSSSTASGPNASSASPWTSATKPAQTSISPNSAPNPRPTPPASPPGSFVRPCPPLSQAHPAPTTITLSPRMASTTEPNTQSTPNHKSPPRPPRRDRRSNSNHHLSACKTPHPKPPRRGSTLNHNNNNQHPPQP